MRSPIDHFALIDREVRVQCRLGGNDIPVRRPWESQVPAVLIGECLQGISI